MKREPLKRIGLIIDDGEYCLEADQLIKLNRWLTEQTDRIDEQGRSRGRGVLVDVLKARGEVYTGVTNGGFEFFFSPTGLGTVVKVSCSATGESIDLTDYDRW